MNIERYIHYVNPIEHDFIASRYLKNRRIDFNLFKSERYIIKKIQTNEVFSGEEYANAVISEYLNRLGKKKFEKLMKTKLIELVKKSSLKKPLIKFLLHRVSLTINFILVPSACITCISTKMI